MKPTLAIVVPCFNEEEVLADTFSGLQGMMERMIQSQLIAAKSFMLFVDDGSRDRTWEMIGKAAESNRRIRGLKLAANAGHQNALIAGLFQAAEFADCLISIDADLQDDITVMPHFIQKFEEGNDIVYGVRSKRDTDTWFKRTSAEGYYKVLKALGVNLVYNHADFRLMSRRAVHALEEFKEVNLFLRGLVPMVGFKSAEVYYDRKERMAGESKYPLKKMLALAFDGLTSFSIRPIRFVTVIGLTMFLLSLAAVCYFLALKILGHTETGWTSLILSIWTIGGLQLMAIGLVGEYIGKIYMETKGRPRYIIEQYKWPKTVLKTEKKPENMSKI